MSIITAHDTQRFSGNISNWFDSADLGTTGTPGRKDYSGGLFTVANDFTATGDVRDHKDNITVVAGEIPPKLKPIETGTEVKTDEYVYYTENSPLPIGTMPAGTTPSNYFGNNYVQTTSGNEVFFRANADFVVGDDVSNHWKSKWWFV